MISLTRRYHFSASHRLHSEALSADRNVEVYGKCNNPYGHGHNYALEITCAGEPDPVSGRIVPIPILDRLVESRVLKRFAFRNLNKDIPDFATLVPTAENIAAVIARILVEHWNELRKPGVTLSRVKVQETDRNAIEILLPQSPHLATAAETENHIYAQI